jgi:hypothetical protein
MNTYRVWIVGQKAATEQVKQFETSLAARQWMARRYGLDLWDACAQRVKGEDGKPEWAADREHIERKRREIAAIEGRHGYCAEAVNKAIAASNRHGRRISPREASAIHRLLKGR